MSGSRSSRTGRIGSDSPAEAHLPGAPLENLRARAGLLAAVRRFFDERGVLEVETPLLCRAGVVDIHLDPFPVAAGEGDAEASGPTRYLMTSPELCMKRLLVAGSGPIYQVTRAFRRGERGRLHNPEFTILEWYRPGYDLGALMDEVEDLVRTVFEASRAVGFVQDAPSAWREPFERITYADAFARAVGLDPLGAAIEELSGAARDRGVEAPAGMLEAGAEAATKDEWLQFLLATLVEESLGAGRPAFIYNYPASQAALARRAPDDARVAERFELYVRGIELANGYHELTDVSEQRSRFEAANDERARRGKARLPLDTVFLDALEAGMPESSGVAVGFDRLVLLALGGSSLDEVLAFPWPRG